MKSISELRKVQCCGCGACAAICPKHAIFMRENKEGFSYPEIDSAKCINCHKCISICAYQGKSLFHNPNAGFAAANKDVTALFKSASGGAFSAIAAAFLRSGGYVCGAEMQFRARAEARHIVIHDEVDLIRLQGSKYVQSDLSDVYSEIKGLLRDGEKLLFSGTPCQVAALKAYLGRKYDKLYTVDLVCHGVPSPGIFDAYVRSLEKKHGKMVEFIFRDKSYGWGKNGSVKFSNGKKLDLPCDSSSYYSLFMSGDLQRENCYTCPYAKSQRVSDLTIGDYWGLERYQPGLLKKMDVTQGVSAILVNTDQGRGLLNYYGDSLNRFETRPEDIVAGNSQLRHPLPRGRLRDQTYRGFVQKGYSSIEILFGKQRVKRKFKHMIKKLLFKGERHYDKVQ